MCQDLPVQIRMIGPFEVRLDDGAVADVPGARLRALLIALALNPGRAVQKATLVDWIWGQRPPSDATNALQRLVSRLRKVLPDGSVEAQPSGYRLLVEPDEVDAVRFERLVDLAHAGEGPRRVQALRQALALWRGAAMQGIDLEGSSAFDAAVTRLEGLHLTAMEDRFDAEISLGHGADLVGELTDLVASARRRAAPASSGRPRPRPRWPMRSGSWSGLPGGRRWRRWPWRRRSSPAGAATPRRRAGSSVSR
jgi:DNA-binding SARP family transcriptional activator